MKNFLNEYKEFINKGDVIVVAVGLVMALYFKAIVDQLIAAVITPIIALIFGEASLDEVGFSISDTFFPIGLVFSAIIDFLAVALILFFVVKAYNRFKGPSLEEAAAVTEIDLLTEIRDQLRSNNPT
jgi:large conductance mechanosensitive channel